MSAEKVQLESQKQSKPDMNRVDQPKRVHPDASRVIPAEVNGLLYLAVASSSCICLRTCSP